MIWSIDSCQNEASADQYHMAISRAQVERSSRSRVFMKLSSDQVYISHWIAGSNFFCFQPAKDKRNFCDCIRVDDLFWLWTVVYFQ